MHVARLGTQRGGPSPPPLGSGGTRAGMEAVGSPGEGARAAVATGGGAVLRDENRSYLKDRGIVVYLDTGLDLLVKRTAKDKKRPLLQNGNPRAILGKIKKERGPLYKEVADVQVYVGENGSKRAVNQILRNLKKEGFVED